jgi:hypothetical protein
MGYLDEAIAMRGRYRRNRASWQPHLENTRSFVLSAADRCRNRSTVVILGSGLLLDVPLAELSNLFREVVLMDVVCLPEVRRHISGYDNVRFVEHDATSIAERLYNNGRDGLPELPEASPVSSEINEDTGLVVSLNILSQLWVVPRTYAARHLRGIPEDRGDEWCRGIVEAHYQFLQSLSCNVCLVADHEFVKRDREGGVVSRASTIFGLTLPEPHASWTWNIASRGKSYPYLSKELNVGAWHVG